MLEFRLNNKSFALDESSRVRLVWKNPACAVDSFPGDQGMGIEIPVNDINRALLGNPERFEKYTKSGDREFPGFEVRYDGYLLMRGTLILESASSSSYSANLRSPVGNLGREHREKYINEMPWKENQTFINKDIYAHPTDEYVAPVIHNKAFWEGKGRVVEEPVTFKDENGVFQERMEEIEYLTQQFRKNNAFLINQRDTGQIKVNTGAVVSPMLFVEYMVKELFRMSGWHIDRNDWNDTISMRQLFMFNNFNILYPNAVSIIDDTRPVWNIDGTERLHKDLRVITETVWQLGTFNYRDLVPHVKMKDFILGLQNYLNFVFHFRDDKKVNIIDRNAIPDRPPIDVDEWFVNEWQLDKRVTRRIKFISEYDENDGFQGDTFQDLTDRIDDFEEAVETFEDLQAILNPKLGELRLVRQENKVYEWKWGVYTGEGNYQEESYQEDILLWEFVSSGPQPYLFGEGEELEEIKTCFSTLSMYYDLAPFIAIPGVLQHGNLSTMRSLWSDFSPRLLFNIPLSGAANINNGVVSLNWDGPNGLIAKRHTNWARLWRDRIPVEAEFNYPVNVIDYVKNNIYEPFRTRHGKFIIEEMQADFALNQIDTTTINGYKV